MAQPSENQRGIAGIIDATRTVEGDGLEIRRAFPNVQLELVDPFLLLDHFGPMTIAANPTGGVPDHPHRGFETVTYLIDGAIEHRDSTGNADVIGPGDVQWMTAGGGIIHSEMLDSGFFHEGGTLHGTQLWVNLPARDKMMAPRYQPVAANEMPTAQSDDGKLRVKVIAGEAMGVHAALDTLTPITYLHYSMAPGAETYQPLPQDHNAFAYVLQGDATAGTDNRPAREGQLVLFTAHGDGVTLGVSPDAQRLAEILLLAGRPINEPIARYGPFVMNTQTEIRQAIRDFQTGRFLHGLD